MIILFDSSIPDLSNGINTCSKPIVISVEPVVGVCCKNDRETGFKRTLTKLEFAHNSLSLLVNISFFSKIGEVYESDKVSYEAVRTNVGGSSMGP